MAMAPPMAAGPSAARGSRVADLAGEVAWPVDGGRGPEVGLVETAGGVRSPQADDGDTVDLVRPLPDRWCWWPTPASGAINAVRLCVGALSTLTGTAAAGATVVVLNRFDPDDPLHADNRAWLETRDGLATVPLPGTEDLLRRSVLA